MHETSIGWICALFLITTSSLLPPYASEDCITKVKSIGGEQTIVSASGNFAFGFFSPGNSSNSYLGIWYNTDPKKTNIWVANGESPLPKNSPATLTIGEDGNLELFLNEKRQAIWSSNVSITNVSVNSITGVLLDTGNLVLRNGAQTLWQSFDHPTNTYVPGMKLDLNNKVGQGTLFRSWTSDEDPRPGNFSAGYDPNGHQFYGSKGIERYWRSSPYVASFAFNSGYMESLGFAYYLTYVVNGDEISLTIDVSQNPIQLRVTINPSGVLQLLIRKNNSWTSLWNQPQILCDFYDVCGSFATCVQNGTLSPCSCLSGFIPKFQEEWAAGNWTSGCARKEALSCDDDDGFLKLQKVKLPDYSVSFGNSTVDECRFHCFSNCSCTAYAYQNFTDSETTVVCLNWYGDLLDMKGHSILGQDMYVRVHGPKLVKGSGYLKTVHGSRILIAVAASSIIIGLIFISIIGYRMRKRFRKEERADSMCQASDLDQNDPELLKISLMSVSEATDFFAEENKLGEGGFGPVYKGKLPGNREVAIKRLSTTSHQGKEEFMNELKLIAKLQHTNLVRLLGCCVEEDEKILIYEYLPNRSLDKWLFVPSENANLNWGKRFMIIEGIAQGLLYLHKFSRLRIIHRDLKASNILLDQEMTPKISDFGLARIFGMNQSEAKTHRVVGTYGYMSPEYALYGRFSEKSDVFSFGVLLLEIVSGKKNAYFHITDLCLTLLQWAWENWKEDRCGEIIDPSIRNACDLHQASKCIKVGLLCVQGNPNQRPIMSDVVLMLSKETAVIPSPREPAFTSSTNAAASDIRLSSRYSNNGVTITALDPR